MLKNVIFMTLLFSMSSISWSESLFSESLCASADYRCLKVLPGETWEGLFPNPRECDLVRRVNRMNVPLKAGMRIAVPKNIEQLSIYDVAPFPRYIDVNHEKVILVSQKQLAFGAYNEEGQLLWWGPISSGIRRCSSPEGNCLTPTGSFRVIRKQDIDCISTVFPVRANGESGGALMPYCMHFLRGFALHGSPVVPGKKASHGCVRLFIEDARWLNEEFITLPGGDSKGTRVIIDS